MAGSFLKEKEKREELKMRAYERQQKEMKELRAEINSLRKIESAAASVRCQMARVEPRSRRSVAQRVVEEEDLASRVLHWYPPAARAIG